MDGRLEADFQGCVLMAATDQPSPWWSGSRHADRKNRFLMARAAITRALRAWFNEQGFAEVETAILQVFAGQRDPSTCSPAPN